MQYYYGCFLENRFGKDRSERGRIIGWLVVAVVLLREVIKEALRRTGFSVTVLCMRM